jgi:predicted SAM-dependent methyltransferase
MNLKPLLKGMATFIPAVYQHFAKGTGGTDNARYCYSVWLRHLVMAKNNRLNANPQVVAELGPGDSLGIGLAALISGCNKYYAFDVVDYADTENNLKIFDELVTLYNSNADIPGEDEFPNVKPRLEKYDFPGDLLNETRLQDALNRSRLDKIRASITNMHLKDSLIKYKVPWFDINVVEKESVDMIFSQAVLEHIDDLANTYKAMHLWLKPTGYISHQIDFKCHGIADEWNGHWTYTDFNWRLMRGKRPYFLNREPHSTHIKMLKKEGFQIICDQTVKSNSNLTRDNLAAKYKYISDQDLITSSAFIQATR